MPTAEGDSAIAVGATVLRSTVTVGSPPPSRQIGAPPVRVSADPAVVFLTSDLGVIRGLEVLYGPQGTPAGQRTSEGDLSMWAGSVRVGSYWERAWAAAAGAAAPISGGGGGSPACPRRSNCGSGVYGCRPLRDGRATTLCNSTENVADSLVLPGLYVG